MEEPDYTRQRNWMVKHQILGRGIHNLNVLVAFMNVRRHIFVPEKYRIHSYEDRPVPIGFDQTISQPYIAAFMTALLKPEKYMRVLEIGTGSGYQTAILSCLCKEVYSVESNKLLSARSRKILNEEGFSNIHLKTGDGYHGWNEFAPFDGIIVTCAPLDIPPDLLDQLGEGGKIVIPAGEKHSQKLFLIEKINGKLRKTESIPVKFVPMILTLQRKDSNQPVEE